MSLTDIVKKQTPHLTANIILGSCSFLGPFSAVLSTGMKALADKPVIYHPWLEFTSVVGFSGAAGIGGLFAYMNQTYGRYRAAQDEKYKAQTTPPIPIEAERQQTRADFGVKG